MADQKKPWQVHYPSQIPTSLSYPTGSLVQFLVNAAEQFPEQEAIHFMGKRMTYQELLEEVYRFTHALKEIGVQPRERVAIMLPNTPQAVISYYSVLLLGAIVVQTNPMYTERELLYQLENSGAETIIVLDLLVEKVQKVKSKTRLQRLIRTGIQDYLPFPKNHLYSLSVRWKQKLPPILDHEGQYEFSRLIEKALPTAYPIDKITDSDVALLQYTGGTTGVPKGAMLTHANLIANTIQVSAWFYRMPKGKGKILGVLPFFHVYGMTTVMNYGVYSASTMILIPKFDPNQILKTASKERPNLFPGAPTIYISLINHPQVDHYDLSSIDACVSGSAPLPLEVQERFEEMTTGRLIEGYGLTETSPVTHVNLIWDRKKSGTIGMPLPDTECRIVDWKTGTEVQQGEIGELQVRGPQVMNGYWNQPGETEESFQDEWFCTGDLGWMDEEGYFYIQDRKKDVIIAGGFNIYPREVEEVLYEHPNIQEVVVIGVPDSYRGETVRAYIVTKDGEPIPEAELNQFSRERLATFKIPKQYVFRDELPKSAIGKILRRVLQKEEE